MRPSRWLTDHLPTWLLVSPWEVTVMTIATARAGLFLVGLTPASSAEQSLPAVLLYVLLSMYGLGAVFTLAQVIRGDLASERIGLSVVGPVAFGYAVAVIAAEPVKGLYAFILYFAVAVACLVRSLVIRKLIRINRAQLRSTR